MSDGKNELLELMEESKSHGSRGTHFFLITRHLRENTRAADKVLNKYNFKLMQLNIDNEVQKELFSLVLDQMEYFLTKNEYAIESYSVIDDDIKKIYSYPITNRSLTFNDIVENQIHKGTAIPKVNNFKEIRDYIWAYCIKIQYAPNKYFISFRKFNKSKVAVEESSEKSFWTTFSTTDNKLKIFNGESINLDRTIDCLFAFDKYYILHKANFENILLLDDEFKDTAEKYIRQLEESGMIDGLGILKKKADTDRRLIRKIAKIVTSNGHLAFDNDRLCKMKETAEEFGIKIKIVENKLIIEDEKDVDNVIKLLDDYFLLSHQTGNKYGASAKKNLGVSRAIFIPQVRVINIPHPF